jgi:flagellar protein FlaG
VGAKTAAQPAERQESVADGKAVPAAAAPKASAAFTAEVAQATQDISAYIQTVNRSLQISVEQDLGTTVITVIDKATEEVVRQIPSEEILSLARFISQQQEELGGTNLPVKGLLMDSEG